LEDQEFGFGSGNAKTTKGEPFVDMMYCVLKDEMGALRIAGL